MRITLSTTSNKYFEAYFNKDFGLYELYWLEASKDMTDDEYKKLMSQQLQAMHESNLFGIWEYQLLDNRLNFFTMSPELQEWQNEHIGTPMLQELGDYPKTAFIQSEDFITQLSFEQTLDETDETAGMVRYFDNVAEAKSWLLGVADSAD